MILFTKAFAVYAAERAIKTAAQAALAIIATAQLGLVEIDWLALASVVGAATLASLLTSVSSFNEKDVLVADITLTPNEEKPEQAPLTNIYQIGK